MLPPAQHYAGGVAGAALDDLDDEMWQLMDGVGDGLLAPPEAQLLAGGGAGDFNAGSRLKDQWASGPSLRDAAAPGTRRRPRAAGANVAGIKSRSKPRRPDGRRGTSCGSEAAPATAVVPACAPQLPLAGERSAVELLSAVISPAVAAYLGRQYMSHFVIAARTEPRAPLGTFHVDGQTTVARAAATMSAVATRYAAEMRQTAAELRMDVDSDAPAWQLGRRVPPHAETMLHLLHLHLQALGAALNDGLSAQLGYTAILQRPLSSPEKAHIDDTAFWLQELHTFLSCSQSLLAQLRCRRGAAVTFVETSAGVLDMIAQVTLATHDGNMERVAEFSPRVAAAEVWPTPYHEHARAVGAVHAMQTFSPLGRAACSSR